MAGRQIIRAGNACTCTCARAREVARRMLAWLLAHMHGNLTLIALHEVLLFPLFCSWLMFLDVLIVIFSFHWRQLQARWHVRN